MKLYTKKGDFGNTDLLKGIRTSKSSLLIECIGNIDEINSSLGIVRAFSNDKIISRLIEQIQHYLFNAGSELAGEKISITQELILEIENIIDYFDAELPELDEFILPGNSKISAFLHNSRTTIRKTERNLVRLKNEKIINNNILAFFNRLSDLMFILARYFDNKQTNQEFQKDFQEESEQKNEKKEDKKTEVLWNKILLS